MIRPLEADARVSYDVAGCFSEGQNTGLKLLALQPIRVRAGDQNGFNSRVAETLRYQLRRRVGQVNQSDARGRFSMGWNVVGNGSNRVRHESQRVESSKTPF